MYLSNIFDIKRYILTCFGVYFSTFIGGLFQIYEFSLLTPKCLLTCFNLFGGINRYSLVFSKPPWFAVSRFGTPRRRAAQSWAHQPSCQLRLEKRRFPVLGIGPPCLGWFLQSFGCFFVFFCEVLGDLL